MRYTSTRSWRTGRYCRRTPLRILRSAHTRDILTQTTWRQKALWTGVVVWCVTAGLSAQTPVTVVLDSVFLGDNTERFGRFRTAETILGSWQRLDADIEVSDRATLKLGVYALERDGAERRTELARPVASLTMGTKRQRFVIGTIETGDRPSGIGPDRTTPHGLLPPLAVETLWFSRAYEAGLQ